MASSSIQFKGVEKVLEAYDNRQVAAWSLFQGKQMIFKHEGSDMQEAAENLQQCLNMLDSSTNAIYTLKIYEDADKIKSNTPDDGSFNFRLNMESQEPGLGAISRANNNNEILSKLNALEERLNQQEEEEGEEDDSPLNNLISGIMGNPALQPVVTQLLTNLAANLLSKKVSAPAPVAAVAGIATDPEQRLAQALQILKSKDPNLADNLYKLASIAEKQPEQFAMLLSMLQNF